MAARSAHPVLGGEKLLAGHTVTLHDGNAVVERYARQDVPENIDGSVAVGEAAAFLRGYTSALLDDHHDATLQLSGGQDSRILLSAIIRLGVPDCRR